MQDTLTKTAEKRLRAAARRGARHLDKHHPGWADLVDLGTLTMSNGAVCVLGQIGHALTPGAQVPAVRGYWDEVIDAPRRVEEYGADQVCEGWLKLQQLQVCGEAESERLGFSVDDGVFLQSDRDARGDGTYQAHRLAWDVLDDEWARLIDARQERS